jgi:hypothetical protein
VTNRRASLPPKRGRRKVLDGRRKNPMNRTVSVAVTIASSQAEPRDGWRPPLEVQRLLREAGYDPKEVFGEVADWYARPAVAAGKSTYANGAGLS